MLAPGIIPRTVEFSEAIAKMAEEDKELVIKDDWETEFQKALYGTKTKNNTDKNVTVSAYKGRMTGTAFKCQTDNNNEITIILFKEGWPQGKYFEAIRYILKHPTETKTIHCWLLANNVYAINPTKDYDTE